MVAHLATSGRYRILEKLDPRAMVDFVRPGFQLKGIILDTETTGLNHRKEDIIEIGLVAFTFDERGGIGDGCHRCLWRLAATRQTDTT